MAPNRVFAAAGLLFTLLVATSHGCIHDQVDHKVVMHDQTYDPMHPFTDEGRRRSRSLRAEDGETNMQDYDRVVGEVTEVSLYQPIRITAYYDNATLDLLPAADRAVIFKVMPAAIAQFRLALQVVPVQGNLTAKRSCYMQYMTTPPVCKTFVENELCLEMPIPLTHFGPTRKCSSCTSAGCSKDACITTPGQGVPNSDFLMYVRSVATEYCSGSVLAYASACQKDQYDRPTFGMVNFCPDLISSDPRDYQSQLATALHEITHALGFSSQFYAYMRNADGTPRTPRDANGRPPTLTTGTCVNGNAADGSGVPSNATVQYVMERNRPVAKLTTPAVAAFVKTHFNCSSVIGAELEGQDDGCLGSHWEERVFEPEYMSPVSSYRNVFSALTLAFFEDSGWYRANASMAERLHFGANQGCAFASANCINSATQTSIAPDHYCTSSDYESCSVDATSRSACTLRAGQTIPTEFRYFADPTKGGYNSFADYCPMNIGFKYGDCADPMNLAIPTGTKINILGESYCPTCKCTASSLRSADSTGWLVSPRRQTGCYAMKCFANGTVVEVTVASGSSPVKVNCTAKGAQVQVANFSGTLTCPDPFAICGSGAVFAFPTTVTPATTIAAPATTPVAISATPVPTTAVPTTTPNTTTQTPTSTTAAPTTVPNTTTPTPTAAPSATTVTPVTTTPAPTTTPVTTTSAPTTAPVTTTSAPTPTPATTTAVPTATPESTMEVLDVPPTATPTATPAATPTATNGTTNISTTASVAVRAESVYSMLWMVAATLVAVVALTTH